MLTELLIVIAVIALLASIAMVAVVSARAKAKDAKARADVSALRSGIFMLAADADKWPNGCPIEEVANPEIQLTGAQAGIIQQPSVGDQGDGCVWIQEDVDEWNGPYASVGNDPWGNPYYFDPDYTPYKNCASETTLQEQPIVVSFGPNGEGLNDYDCDDIFLNLK